MTELERARQEMEEWFCSPTCRHCNEMRQLMSTLERLGREDERQKLRDTGIERAITHPECW